MMQSNFHITPYTPHYLEGYYSTQLVWAEIQPRRISSRDNFTPISSWVCRYCSYETKEEEFGSWEKRIPFCSCEGAKKTGYDRFVVGKWRQVEIDKYEVFYKSNQG